MTHPTRPTSSRLAAVAAVALAGLAAGASPALAERTVDPVVYETGVPAGVVEHGVVDFSITGSPVLQHTVTEYWASQDRWRSRVTDGKGKLLRETFSTKASTTTYSARTGKVTTHEGPETPPLAGWTAGYNRKLVERGTVVQTGTRTVAGIPGLVFEVPGERKTTDPDAGEGAWVTDNTDSATTLVLEAGTFAPLVRRTQAPNGEFGLFVQEERLTERDRTAATATSLARLTAKAKAKAVKRWKAKAAAARKRGR